jgi:hypothetical protein
MRFCWLNIGKKKFFLSCSDLGVVVVAILVAIALVVVVVAILVAIALVVVVVAILVAIALVVVVVAILVAIALVVVVVAILVAIALVVVVVAILVAVALVVVVAIIVLVAVNRTLRFPLSVGSSGCFDSSCCLQTRYTSEAFLLFSVPPDKCWDSGLPQMRPLSLPSTSCQLIMR